MQMDRLTRNEVLELIEYEPSQGVSLYMPTHPGSPQEREDRIRLKNLVGQATEELIERGVRRSEATEILAPVAHLPEELEFWRHRRTGLACFCARDFHRLYRLPLGFEEQLFINGRFHICPLLPLLHQDVDFYILALSHDAPRLFAATPHTVEEVELPHVEEAEIDSIQPAFKHHAMRDRSQGNLTAGDIVFHGHGGAPDRFKADLMQHLLRVEQVVSQKLRGQSVPLVLACVEYLAPLYEEANAYPHLVKAIVQGSPESWTIDQLRKHAWKQLEPQLRQRQEKALEELQRRLANQRASSDLREIVVAANTGRVETLFLQQCAGPWGRYDREAQTVEVSDSADGAQDDLFNLAASGTIGGGGEVWVLDDIPSVSAPLAASYRY